MVNLHASALIIDLDGRFNVNAHGSLVNMPVRNGATTDSIYGTTPAGPQIVSSMDPLVRI